jgi:hypothetical protein
MDAGDTKGREFWAPSGVRVREQAARPGELN